MQRQELSVGTVRELLVYDPETGIFTWRIPRPKIRVGQRAGCLHHKGYRVMELFGKYYSEHRLAWFYIYGQWPRDQIDHINRNKADNRITNLREATQAQNQANTPARQKNKTGLKGASFNAKAKCYVAQIRLDGRSVQLGSFTSAEDAHAAYLVAAKALHKEFAYTGNRGDE